MNDLHLYIEILNNESTENAIERTRKIIGSTFDEYGYSIHEIGGNEDLNNEIKAFLSVDTNKEKLYEITSNLCAQLY